MRVDDPFVGFVSEYEPLLKQKRYTHELLEAFKGAVWHYYKHHKREFAWRSTTDPYQIVVSEIMLQQTQTYRVKEKFLSFTQRFVTFEELACASTAQVLQEWVGLGYNRRALALHAIAQKVVQDFEGQLPDDPVILQTFRGLGPATAASIVAFAFNKPTLFIETNIRTVFLHAFFQDSDEVHDKQLMPLIEASVCRANPREWYYALMDCGVLLKQLYPNPSRKSRHHTIQSKFEGSVRQIRGGIVKHLAVHKKASRTQLRALFEGRQQEVDTCLIDLLKEGFLKMDDNFFYL